mgnify:CR=1 FL=1
MAFLKARNLGFGRGEWICLMGPSGSGKTSLMKAINGLWPHGAGDIILPEGARSFYAPQDVKLPRLTLKRLVCLPDTDELHTDVRVASALHDDHVAHAHVEALDDEREARAPALYRAPRRALLFARQAPLQRVAIYARFCVSEVPMSPARKQSPN